MVEDMQPLFHVAPASARAAIAREGLDGLARKHLYLARPATCCVYLFGSLDAAARWAVQELFYGEQALREGWDVWQVNADRLELDPDPSDDFTEADGACFTTQPVEATRLRLIGGASPETVEQLLAQSLAARLLAAG